MDYEIDINALFATYKSLLPMKPEDRDRLWQKFRLDWNYNSNRIEGNTLTLGETKELLEQGIKPVRMRRDILHMQSHDKAIDFLRELVESDRVISEVDIRALHKTALGENYWTEAVTSENVITKREIEIGTYKKVPNMVLKMDGTTHEYAPPQEVHARMEVTVKRIKAYLKNQDAPLHDFLAELHQDFIHTHPFDDGNGRIVRLLLNYVCLKLGRPPVIIKSDKRPEYIAALESWNDGNKEHLRKMVRDELIWSLEKSIKAARGEDIDDPEDLDKEIDLFVREHADQIKISTKSEKMVSHVLADAYLPIIIHINNQIQKLHPFFDQIYDLNHFDGTVVLNYLKAVIKQNSTDERFQFVNFNKTKGQYQIDLIISLEVEYDAYKIFSYLDLKNTHEEASGMASLLLKEILGVQSFTPVEFSQTSYAANIHERDVKKFCDESLRKFMNLLKDLQNLET